MLLFGVAVTLCVLVLLAELLPVMPLPDVLALSNAYWETVAEDTSLVAHAGYVWFMLMNVWILWVIPLFGLLAMILALQVQNDEEVGAYLERIHIVENELRQARERTEMGDDRWNNVNRRLDELFDHSAEAWVVTDPAKGIRRWNRSALELARRSNPALDNLEGQPWANVVSSPELGQAVQESLASGRSWSGEVYVKNLQQWLLVWLFPLGEEFAFLIRDVSHMHREENFLQSSEALLRQLVEDSIRPVAVLDAEWRYLYVSRKWPEVMGLAENVALLRQDHRVVVPGFPGDMKVLEQQLAGGQVVGREEERRLVHGREMVLNWHIRPWHDAGGRLGGYIFTAVDMTETVRLRQQVSQAEERENALAYSDALTGLANRQLFHDRLNMALAQAYRQLGKVALFFLDLDGFKGVNDQLGHDYGDLLLKQVAERLKTCVRQTDTVARLGGDEFTVILAIRDKNDAEQVAQKILTTIRAAYDLNGKVADKVGTSIGIALYPQDGSQAADLMKKADSSMYAAKQAGKNTYRFATMEIKVEG